MLAVTESARELLGNMCEQAQRDAPGTVYRLATTESEEFGLLLAKEEKGDEVIRYQGATVLVLTSELAHALDGVTIDRRDTPKGTELIFSGRLGREPSD